jgi:hypothetical protein
MGAVLGIELPEGNPGAVESAADSLRHAAGEFASAAQTVRQAENVTGLWRGFASFVFRDHCGQNSEAARAGERACQKAATALRAYGRELEDARDKVRELKRQGEACVTRIDAADARAGAAGAREGMARLRAVTTSLTVPDGGATAALAQREADAAQAEREQAQRDAAAARAELRRLQERAEKERERVKEAAKAAAGKVGGAVGLLPSVYYSQAAPIAVVEEADDGGGGGLFGKIVHGTLDVGGFVPGLGAIPDLLNAGIYLAEGDTTAAAISGGAAIPIAGDIGKGAKMTKEAVEAAAKSGKAVKTIPTIQVGGRALPAYTKGPGGTKGVFKGGDEETPLQSGYDGPSKDLPTDKPIPGMNNNIKSHVEAHAAAVMRMKGIKEAELWINRIPCARDKPPQGCHLMLERMLPEGSTLTVHGPDGFKWVYRGIADP